MTSIPLIAGSLPPRSAVEFSSQSNELHLPDPSLILTHRQGIPFEQAENGKEAVELFEAAYVAGNPFNLFCTDVQMPIMDGLEAAHAVRAYETEVASPRRCKIIALTGLSNEEDMRTAESDIDYWVVKGGKSMRIILEEIGRLQQEMDSTEGSCLA